MGAARTEMRQAGNDELSALATVFGSAFVTEPMMRWPLGAQEDPVAQCTRCFSYFLEEALDLGFVTATADTRAAAVWVPPNAAEGWEGHPWNQPRIRALTDDGGRRYDRFWDWIYSHDPKEKLWQLDSIAVEPRRQGKGLGRALIEAGLERARADRVGAFLSTGTRRNVDIYGSRGFQVVEDTDAPDGGPHIWFMRWDP